MPKEPARPAPEDCTTKTEGSGDLSLCLRTYNFSIFKIIHSLLNTNLITVDYGKDNFFRS